MCYQICPCCNNQTFQEGDTVDVGVGSVQCSAGFCDNCGYIEKSGYDYDKDQLSYQQFCKLWELQIAPFEGMP